MKVGHHACSESRGLFQRRRCCTLIAKTKTQQLTRNTSCCPGAGPTRRPDILVDVGTAGISPPLSEFWQTKHMPKVPVELLSYSLPLFHPPGSERILLAALHAGLYATLRAASLMRGARSPPRPRRGRKLRSCRI